MANTIDKVIKTALNEVGYLEKKSNSQLDNKTANAGSNNYTKYARDLDKISDFFNGKKQGYAWCSVFVSWCFVSTFGEKMAKALTCQPNKSSGAGCLSAARYYKNNGQFHAQNPKVGDQIFFWNATKSGVAHTGLVYDVDTNYVYTVEGNTSGASGVIANGGGVCKKRYPLNYACIYGYGRPNYDIVPVDTQPTKKDEKIDTVKEVQKWANTNYKSGLTVDGIYGAKTKKALVKILQTELNQTYNTNLVVDGIWGNKTKAACPNLKKGDENDVVGVLQALLICNQIPNVYVDGDFGSVTFSAVETYQRKNGLVVDGIAGKNTFAELCN